MSAEPIVLSWSGGKDSSLALAALRRDPRFEVVALLTSVTREFDRISIHGVRRALLEAQTAALAAEIIALGYTAHLVCVDTEQLPAGFVGRVFDAKLLAELPGAVDPCGERGEFHTFVSDGPIFARQVRVALGDIVIRESRF